MFRLIVCFVYVYINTALQSQKAVSAYFTSKQMLPFDIALENTHHQWNMRNVIP